LCFSGSRPGGKYGPPVKIEAAKVIGDSDSRQRGGAGQGGGQGHGERGQGGQGRAGQGEGIGVQQQGVCVREDLDRASHVLATAFKVLNAYHSLNSNFMNMVVVVVVVVSFIINCFYCFYYDHIYL
jgi:hypothetical protein